MVVMDPEEWNQRYRQMASVWGDEPNQFVAAALGDLPAARALDLGCGEGRNALWLAERGWRVTAVDFSRVALDKGRDAAMARGLAVDWVEADLTAYRPESAAFAAVVTAYLHLPAGALEEVLRRAAGAVAPGGVLVVVGHDAINLAEGTGGPQDPEILYTPDWVASAVGALSVSRAERVRRTVAGADRPAIDTLVVATRALDHGPAQRP